VIVFTRTLPVSLDTYISHGLRDGASILGGQVNNSHLRGDIGLLVFDESGASLDPTADQGMTYMTSL